MPYSKAASGALLCILFVLPGLTGAEVNGVSEPDPAEGLWQRSRETAEAWWENSRSMARSAWEQTQDWWLTGDDEDQTFGQLWRDLVPRLEETLQLQDQQADLPEYAWFTNDQLSNQADINALLDEAVGLLSVSPVQRYREQIRELNAEIEQARQEIAEYRTRRVSAPQDALWERTVADYEEAIAERESRIDGARRELRDTKHQFSAELRRLGLELNDEQLEFLLATVVGDNLVDLSIAFDNVKAITVQLEQLLQDSDEDLASARRYYGMYVVLLKVLERMHLQLIGAIDEHYLPQIDAIVRRTRDLEARTRRLRQQPGTDRRMLDANLEAQRLTLRAAAVYREYLVDQSRQVVEAQRGLARDIATAWNTYETVKVSGELVALIRHSRNLLDNLLERQVPALRPFENLAMQREFVKLTAQLRAATPS